MEDFIPEDPFGIVAAPQQDSPAPEQVAALQAPSPNAIERTAEPAGLNGAREEARLAPGLGVAETRFERRPDGTEVQTWADGRVQIKKPGGDWSDGTSADAAATASAAPRVASPAPKTAQIAALPNPAPAAPDPKATSGAIPDSYFGKIRAAESGGNDSAKNPRSSATGRYQFTSGTWAGLAKNHPDLGLTPNGRFDPEQQERAIRQFTQNNADALRRNGISVNGGTLYAAHFLGAGGAVGALKADPGAPMASVVGPGVVRANPFLAKMTVGDFQSWAARKGGGDIAPMNSAAGTQVARISPSEGAMAAQTEARGRLDNAQAEKRKEDARDAMGLLAQLSKQQSAPGLATGSPRPQSASPNALQGSGDAEITMEIATLDQKIGELQRTAHASPEDAALLSALHQRRSTLQLAS